MGVIKKNSHVFFVGLQEKPTFALAFGKEHRT